MIIKILKRTAQLSEKHVNAGPPESQSKKLDIPKKTKLYVDQTTRERDNAISKHAIHFSFKLFLRASHKLLSKSKSHVS